MTTKPSQKLKAIASIFALSLTYSSESRAQKEFYREFLNNSEIVAIAGEQTDEHHARLNSIQITHDQFQELRILNPETGATEVLEFTNPILKVTYSMPLNGRFLRLEIKKRESDGFRTANLILASDKSHYVLVRNTFKPFQVFYSTSFDISSASVCWKPDADMLNRPPVDPILDPLLNTPLNIAKKSLSSSCQTPLFKDELDKMQSGIALVVSTRDSSAGNGQFLSCLNNHNLQHIASEMQKDFTESLKDPTQPTVACIYEDKIERGEFSQRNNLIYFRSPWAYGRSLATENDAALYYADTFFHESLHKAGIQDDKEDMVKDAVSCCGFDKSKDRTSACNDLDKNVKATNERNAQILASVDKLKGFSDFWIKVEKDTDAHRMNVIYDDFFDMLKKGGNTQNNSLASCLKITGKSQDDCYKNFIQNTDNSITQYFDNDCHRRFIDKSRAEQDSICEDLKSSALNIVNTNAYNVCDSSKSNAIEKSCLYAVGVGKKGYIDKAQKEGDLLDVPELLANNPNAELQMKLRDSFLTSYAKEIPALKTAYNQIKDSYGDETAISLFSSLINFMGPTMKTVKADYAKCIASNTAKTQCTKDAQDFLMNSKEGLEHFFRRDCKVAFTTEEAASKPCKDIKALVMSALKDSVTKSCKPSDPSKQIGVPGDDLTCIFTASDEGVYNFEHYDQLKKEGKLRDADGDLWAYTPEELKKQAAATAARSSTVSIKSTHIADEANRQLASDASRGSSHGGRSGASRSPASASQGPVEAFNPSRAAFDQIAAQVRNDQPSGGRTILNDAAHMMSSLVIPPAQAETRDDTYNLVAKVPAAIVPGGSAIAGDLETTRAINVGVVDPLSVFGSARSARAKDESAAKAQPPGPTDRAAASADAMPNRSPASASASAAASTASKNAATAGSRAAASGHDSKASSAEQQHKHLATDSPESLHSRQKDLLYYIKHHPAEALNRLKFEAVKRPGTRTLSEDLANDQIQAIDDAGKKHGAEKPQISISYDSQSGIFVGIPEL